MEDRCEWAASYFTDHSSHFPYILYGEGERADPQRGVAIIMWSYNANHIGAETGPAGPAMAGPFSAEVET